MGLAGAGFGAAKALEEILGEQMLRAQLAQREQQAQQEMELKRQQFEESKRQSDVDSGQRQQQIDMQAGDRRQRTNVQNVRRMLGEAMTQGGADPQTMQGMAFSEGIDLPQAPKVVRHAVTTNVGGKPVKKLVTEDELAGGIEEYREPKTPQKPDRDPIADHEAKLKLDAKYKTGQGAGGPSPYSQERAARTVQSVDELLGKVNRWTTGVGSMTAMVPETGARNFKAELDTLKANVAFNELTAMREASKTGGALGAVSDKEMQLLQSALGALDQGQSPENIKAQLGKIKESVERWQAAAGAAPTGATVTPKPDSGSRVDELLKKYGKPK